VKRKLTLLLPFTLIGILIVIFWTPEKPLASLQPIYGSLPSEFIDIQGMPLHLRDEGPLSDSLPLVFLHGTGSSLHTWLDWVDKLKAEHRCLSFDLPAFGLTGPHPERDYSLDRYQSVLRDVLESRGIEKAILVGNSLGGLIAWKYALQYPEQVSGLVLVDPAGVPQESKERPLGFRLASVPVVRRLLLRITPKSLVEKSVANVFGDPALVTEALVDRYFDLLVREGNRQAFLDRAQLSWRDSSYVQLENFEGSVLLMWGGEDRLTPPTMAEEFQRVLDRDTLVVFPSLGHVPMEESPEVTLPVLEDWLYLMK
jgi:pimeloyl-ACP methyl ester carboxylesterase